MQSVEEAEGEKPRPGERIDEQVMNSPGSAKFSLV